MTLPKGWVTASIGDLVEPIETDDPRKEPDLTFRYVDIGSIDNEAFRIADPKEIAGRDAPSRARRRIRSGDVLFSTVRPYLRNIAMVPPELDGEFTSTGVCVLRAGAGVEPGYLFRRVISQDFVDSMTLASDGTMYPAIADRDVFSASANIPPAAEQRRIVAKLDALTARLARARAELDRVPVLAAHFRTKALLWCFRGCGDATIELGTRLHAIEAGKNLRCDERPPREGESGVVKVSAVTWGRFDSTQSKTLPSNYRPPEKARIQRGDLLISRANTLELVGAVALVECQPRNLFLSDKILRLAVDDADKRWIMWFLRSPDGRRQIESSATGNQLSMRNISQETLRLIRLPFPDAETRQGKIHRLEALLARADRLEADAARARKLIDRLESAILAKAFRGELVPQDPNDEPASVLLGRVRAQRAASSKPKRSRRAAAATA